MKTARRFFFAFTLSWFAPAAGADTLRTVALSGNNAPGTSSGVNFSSFLGAPILNNSGQIAFKGNLTGLGVDRDNDHGLWAEGGGNGLVLVARTAHFTSSFHSFGNPVINNAGQTAFKGRLSDNDASRNTGVWSEGGGNGLHIIARLGSPAPGVNGVFRNIFTPVFNDAGQTAFKGNTEPWGKHGIWTEGGGNGLAPIAIVDFPAPGIPGAQFSALGTPILNAAGQVAFSGFLSGTGNASDSGIWSGGGASDSLALAVRVEDEAPGTSNDIKFAGGFANISINSSGEIAFSSFLAGTDINSNNNSGVWSEGGGNGLTLVAREGNAAPGTNSGVSYKNFNDVVLNDSGQTAFSGFLTGTGISNSNNRGIWAMGESGLTLVAREGHEAPGTEGANFTSNFGSDLVSIAINIAGQTAFYARITGSSNSNDGIWAQNSFGVLKLIAREGDLLDVDDGPGIDFRTISSLFFVDMNGNGDGRPSGFNDQGQVAFTAFFTDGSSGIFVSDLVATFPGDYNQDGVVDTADYTVWRDTQGQTGSGLAADGNGDGTVDADDYNVWVTNFGQTAPATSNAIPEPGALILLCMSSVGLLFQRR